MLPIALSNKVRCALIVLLMLSLGAVSYLLWLRDKIVAAENGILEASQTVLLLFAAIIHIYYLITSQTKLYRELHAGLALFLLSLMLRESEIDAIGSSIFWSYLEQTLRAVIVIIFVAYLVFMFRQTRTLWQKKWIIATTPTVYLTFIACIIYALGWPFDKNIFPIPAPLSLYFEELFELYATIIFVVAANAGAYRRFA